MCLQSERIRHSFTVSNVALRGPAGVTEAMDILLLPLAGALASPI